MWWLQDNDATQMRAHGDDCIVPVRDEEKHGEIRVEDEGEVRGPCERSHVRSPIRQA